MSGASIHGLAGENIILLTVWGAAQAQGLHPLTLLANTARKCLTKNCAIGYLIFVVKKIAIKLRTQHF